MTPPHRSRISLPNILQWALTLTPTVWLLTIFAESLRAKALVGKMPSRYVALSEEAIQRLHQDWLFQTLKGAIAVTLWIATVSFILWIPITLAMADRTYRQARGHRLQKALKAVLYLLFHLTLFLLPLLIFLFEPTGRADWLFD